MHTAKPFFGPIYALCALLVLMVNTLIFFIPVLLIGLLKLIPIQRWRVCCAKTLDKIVINWTRFNNFYINKTHSIQWDIEGFHTFTPNQWYLIVANHQSWVDILVLQHVFGDKIPMMKFFIKDQLKWIPLLGFAWWAMGCPYMKRYTKDYLAKKPHKQGKDLASTQKAMELFQHVPSTIINFIEGTRFTLQKQSAQGSPYKHLLKPKAGGISYVIQSMRDHIKSIIDVTIIYPEPQNSIWDFLCHRIRRIQVRIRELPIPAAFTDVDITACPQLQHDFRLWLNNQWALKDQVIERA